MANSHGAGTVPIRLQLNPFQSDTVRQKYEDVSDHWRRHCSCGCSQLTKVKVNNASCTKLQSCC